MTVMLNSFMRDWRRWTPGERVAIGILAAFLALASGGALVLAESPVFTAHAAPGAETQAHEG
jgi:hypothetical protein